MGWFIYGIVLPTTKSPRTTQRCQPSDSMLLMLIPHGSSRTFLGSVWGMKGVSTF